jgi:hypothetical protein
VAEKFRILLIANAIVDQDQAVAVFHQQTAHSPGTQIILIGRIAALPERFRNYAKHSATIQLKKSGIYYVQVHD